MTIDPEYEGAYNEELDRLHARYSMESCEPPTLRPVSSDTALSLELYRELPFDPFP